MKNLKSYKTLFCIVLGAIGIQSGCAKIIDSPISPKDFPGTQTPGISQTPTYSPSVSATPTGVFTSVPAATFTFTPLPGATATLTPTFTSVFTALPTATFSKTPTLTPAAATSTLTPTFTQTPFVSPTATFSVTPTATGCALVGFYIDPSNTAASAGTTAVGFDFNGGYAPGVIVCTVSDTFTSLTFTASTTGNLNSAITTAQLWTEYPQTLAASTTFNPSGFTFTISPAISVGATFEVEYVLPSTASGTVQTTVTGATGLSAGYSIEPLLNYIGESFKGGILTVTP